MERLGARTLRRQENQNRPNFRTDLEKAISADEMRHLFLAKLAKLEKDTKGLSGPGSQGATHGITIARLHVAKIETVEALSTLL